MLIKLPEQMANCISLCQQRHILIIQIIHMLLFLQLKNFIHLPGEEVTIDENGISSITTVALDFIGANSHLKYFI